MDTHKHYPTDLTDGQWSLVERQVPQSKSGPGKRGRPASDLRRVVNGILYVNKTGCQWRRLPSDFGLWPTAQGISVEPKRCLEAAHEQPARIARRRQGRRAEPSAGCVDSQSVKAATQGQDIGFDGGKKVKGRKRHVLVDTLGLILAVVVTAANTSDQRGFKALLTDYFTAGVRRLRPLWVDGGYSGLPLANWVLGLKQTHKVRLEVVEREGQGFQVVKRRWVVERTLAWVFNYRRHSKDYEVLTDSSEAMIQISMIHVLLRRLT